MQAADAAPEPLDLIQDAIFHPRRFSAAVLHSGLEQVLRGVAGGVARGVA